MLLEKTRICKTCALEKSIENFTFLSNKGNFSYGCRSCDSIYSNEKFKKRYPEIKDSLNEKRRFEYSSNDTLRNRILNENKKHRDANLETYRKNRQDYYNINKEACLETCKKWYEKNIDSVKEYKKNWFLKFYPENKEKYYNQAHKRRLFETKAFPSWASNPKIEIIFKAKVEEEKRTGQKYHVDHIVPLISKLVCGFHSEDNLQILLAKDNLKKKNFYWPDMFDTKNKDLIKMAKDFYAKTN